MIRRRFIRFRICKKFQLGGLLNHHIYCVLTILLIHFKFPRNHCRNSRILLRHIFCSTSLLILSRSARKSCLHRRRRDFREFRIHHRNVLLYIISEIKSFAYTSIGETFEWENCFPRLMTHGRRLVRSLMH